MNAPVSIRDNLLHFSNVSDERLQHRQKDFAPKVATEEGMQIDRIPAPENADASIHEMVEPLSKATCDMWDGECVARPTQILSTHDGIQIGAGWRGDG
jgi:hypothetical protein